MVDKNLHFTITNELGVKVTCYVLTGIRISENEFNIIYSRSDDGDDEVRYGRLTRSDDQYLLSGDISDIEFRELKSSLDSEIYNMLNGFLYRE